MSEQYGPVPKWVTHHILLRPGATNAECLSYSQARRLAYEEGLHIFKGLETVECG